MRISDWSSDVCSSDLDDRLVGRSQPAADGERRAMRPAGAVEGDGVLYARARRGAVADLQVRETPHQRLGIADRRVRDVGPPDPGQPQRLAAARAAATCVPALETGRASWWE